jgi:hypothetical protein
MEEEGQKVRKRVIKKREDLQHSPIEEDIWLVG